MVDNMTEDEEEENEYENRVMGVSKKVQEREKQRPVYHKKKCTKCKIGFNRTSSFEACKSCDKLTHIRCIRKKYIENNFTCELCSKKKEKICKLLKLLKKPMMIQLKQMKLQTNLQRSPKMKKQ